MCPLSSAADVTTSVHALTRAAREGMAGKISAAWRNIARKLCCCQSAWDMWHMGLDQRSSGLDVEGGPPWRHATVQSCQRVAGNADALGRVLGHHATRPSMADPLSLTPGYAWTAVSRR